MPAVVNPEKCTGCETCVESCPLDAIAMKDGLAVVDADTCGDCGAVRERMPCGSDQHGINPARYAII